jgi:hypothetical protein
MTVMYMSCNVSEHQYTDREISKVRQLGVSREQSGVPTYDLDQSSCLLICLGVCWGHGMEVVSMLMSDHWADDDKACGM